MIFLASPPCNDSDWFHNDDDVRWQTSEQHILNLRASLGFPSIPKLPTRFWSLKTGRANCSAFSER